MIAKITAAATAQSDRRPSQNLPLTLRRSPRLSQNQPRTDKGLDVAVPEGGDSLKKRKRSAQNDGDGKQKESSSFKQQQVERQRLLREENRRIREGRGFDFGDIPPIGPFGGRLFEPCWAEKSLYPAPKVYEDMAKIGLKSYNWQYDTSCQFTKILRVYFFFKTEEKSTHNLIFFQAEEKSVASPEDFMLTVASIPSVTVVSSCMKEKDIRYYTALDRWRSCSDTSYQFTEILRAEDKSVASPENFKLLVGSVPGTTAISSCRKETDFGIGCYVCEY